jgi:hypothetical protein
VSERRFNSFLQRTAPLGAWKISCNDILRAGKTFENGVLTLKAKKVQKEEF